jgi:hypothetical protein
MKGKAFPVLLLILAFDVCFTSADLTAQERNPKPVSDRKLEKEKKQALAFARTDSLVSSRQFVFEAEFSQGSDLVYVVVDSIYGEVQNGNRNNLQGHITQFEVTRDQKRKELSVSMKMRGVINTADVFLFISSYGSGKATVKSDFPGNFTFYGKVTDFKSTTIHQEPSHMVH